jgi:ABC-type sugar transport system ATPase subunit
VIVTLTRGRMGMIRNITVAFDDSGDMSVYKQRTFAFILRSFSREMIDQRVREAVEIPEILDLSDRKSKQFSGGKQ